MLIGADYGFAWDSLWNQRARFVDMLEFLTMDAIMAATRLVGEITGMGQCLDQVRPGYLADLLLVDGESLEDVAILQQCDCFSAIKKIPGILEIVERGIAQARS